MAKEPESNPWPGFVDALSTTLLVFVFLVVVLVLVVTVLSMKVGQDVAAKVVEQAKNAAGASQAEQMGGATSIKSDKNDEILSAPDEINLKKLLTTKGDQVMKVRFEDLSSLMSADAGEELKTWIEEHLEEVKNRKVYIIGLLHSREVATSTSYYVSFNRVMATRKIFMDFGIPSEQIKVRVDNSGSENRNEVVIQLGD